MTEPAPIIHRYSYADYLALEQDGPVKHEFLRGEIYAMAGGTPEHAALAMSVATLLGPRLVGGACRLFSSDLRVRVLATGLTTYPDLTVVRGPIERDPENANTVVNPTFLVEVTSPGTEDYDRGEKLDHYRRIPTLRSVLLVSHRERALELWTRNADAWTQRRATMGEEIEIPGLDLTIAVDAIYQDLLEDLVG